MAIFYAVLAILALQAYGEVNQKDAEEFLLKYGYLNAKTRSPLAKETAIKEFQDYAGLQVTGVLDEETKEKMEAPRCGVKDKRTRSGYKWPMNNLKWALIKGTPQINDGLVRQAIKEAFDIWAAVVPLNFTETNAQDQSANLKFSFGAQGHGCYWPFDGKGGVLAHAAMPTEGYLHFDEDEQWTYKNPKQIKEYYTDLLSVTIHELGHALGLPHLKEEDAIMFAFYRHPELDKNDRIKPFVLSQYDIAAIQRLYGPKSGGTVAPATPKPATSAPGDCIDQVPVNDCLNRKAVCSHESMKYWCPKTCGFC